MSRIVPIPTPADLAQARDIVAEYVPPTPLLPIGDRRWLKLESFQPVGAFKARGAIAALKSIDRSKRIVTASAGNHALGIAWASQQLGIPVTIVVAESAAPVKIAKLQAMGADLVLHGANFDEAEAYAIRRAADDGYFLSAYNDTQVIAGQATVLDEILAQLPDDGLPLTLVTPVGGGGLLSGIALRAPEYTDREIRLIGVEAEQSLAISSGVAAGHTVEVPVGDTLADGLAGNAEPGSITVDILRDHAVEFVAVSEEEIRDSIRWLFHEKGLVAEGAAATSIAVMRQRPAAADRHTVAIVTGRNITWPTLRDILDEPGNGA